jgi:hypothetical protein
VNEVEVVEEGNAGEKLTGKALYLRAWEWHETIALEEVEDTLAEEVCDNADMATIVEGIA